MKNRMTGTALVLAVSLLAFVYPASAAGRAQGCAADLRKAEAALKSAWNDPRTQDAKVSEALELHRQAFALCETMNLTPEDAAYLAERRGIYLADFEHDFEGAVNVFREALVRVTAQAGKEHPARIRLLEGEAEALEKLTHVPGREKNAASDRLMWEDLTEAYSLRILTYGADSVEAAQGLRLLALYHVNDRPALAESELRKSLAALEGLRGEYDPEVLETVAILDWVLRQQGRTDEAEKMSVRYGKIYNELQRRGVAID